MLHTYGEKGSGPAGKLDNPRLCQSDSEDALLVADHGNDRLQLLDSRRTWNIINMDPAMKQPISTVYTDGKLYVVPFSENMLYAYSEK